MSQGTGNLLNHRPQQQQQQQQQQQSTISSHIPQHEQQPQLTESRKVCSRQYSIHHQNSKSNIHHHQYHHPRIKFLQLCSIGVLICVILALIYQHRNGVIFITLHSDNNTNHPSTTGTTTTSRSRNSSIPLPQQQPPQHKWSMFLHSILKYKQFNAKDWNLNPHIWSYRECRQRRRRKENHHHHSQRHFSQSQQSHSSTSTETPKDDDKSESLRLSTTTSTTTAKATTQTTTTLLPTLDIISTGSITKMDYLHTQQYHTFGQHDSIRYFFPITEVNDTDYNCAQQLSIQQYNNILRFCQSSSSSSSQPPSSKSTTLPFKNKQKEDDYSAMELRHLLFGPKRSPPNNNNHHRLQDIGWLCAQKRPIDGLRIAIEHYRQLLLIDDNHTSNRNNTSINNVLPDYLLFIDDDTYIHVDVLIATLLDHYPSNEVHVLAGCVYHKPIDFFSFPWGGYGTILSRAALQRFLQPIDCNSTDHSSSTTSSSTSDDEENDTTFNQYVCWRIYQHNYINEASYFKDGMSVADLMITYTQQLAYTKINEWNNSSSSFGYCFHSDHTLAYFLNFYFITTAVLPPFPTSHQPRNKWHHHYQHPSEKSDDHSTATATFHYMEQLRKDNPILSINPCSGTDCRHNGYKKCQWDPVSQSQQQRRRQSPPHICHNIEPNDMLLLYTKNER